MGAIHPIEFTEELYKMCPRKYYVRDMAVAYSDDKTERQYTIYNRKNKVMVSFKVRPLPGCCGVLVAYYIRPNMKKDSEMLFKGTIDLILEAASKAKFGQVIITQRFDSTGVKVMDGLKWDIRMPFTNGKTLNTVITYIFNTKLISEPVAEVAHFEGE